MGGGRGLVGWVEINTQERAKENLFLGKCKEKILIFIQVRGKYRSIEWITPPHPKKKKNIAYI